jgi:hypothetical protein
VCIQARRIDITLTEALPSFDYELLISQRNTIFNLKTNIETEKTADPITESGRHPNDVYRLDSTPSRWQ